MRSVVQKWRAQTLNRAKNSQPSKTLEHRQSRRQTKTDRLRLSTLVNNTPIATMSSTTSQSVACFGKKRTATAVAIAKTGKGLSTFSWLGNGDDEINSC